MRKEDCPCCGLPTVWMYDEHGPVFGFRRPTMSQAVVALVAFLCWPDNRFKQVAR